MLETVDKLINRCDFQDFGLSPPHKEEKGSVSDGLKVLLTRIRPFSLPLNASAL